MSIWQFIKNWRMGFQRKNQKYNYILGEPLSIVSTNSATQEKPNQLNSNSLAVSPPDLKKDELYQRWILLSPREQDVTALTCLRYTNPQIAARLGISVQTVKTNIVKILLRLNLQSKADLRVVFANWDFSEWERRNDQR